MKFKCDRCGYETNQKGNLKRHLTRKNKCIGEIDINYVIKKYSIKIKNKYECSFCLKEFNTYQSRWRHQKKYCKLKKLENKVNEIQPQNITQNIQTQNIQNIGTQNIIIVKNYNNENMEEITDKTVKNILYFHKRTAIPRLVEKIHFNKKYPENHNIAITNVSGNYGYIRIGGRWEMTNRQDLIERLLNDKYNMINECFEYMPAGMERRKYYIDKLTEDLCNKKETKNIKKAIAKKVINKTKELKIKPKN
tara:strand:+ start:221 stop:970 length:750 start_codon:yes stop_codon:yes gene_type:complete